MGTPTAVAVCRKILLANGSTTKIFVPLTKLLVQKDDPLLKERSIRRTIKKMVRLGLVRYEPWKCDGNLILTGVAKKIYRAGGYRC